jgi:hypothetical protein
MFNNILRFFFKKKKTVLVSNPYRKEFTKATAYLFDNGAWVIPSRTHKNEYMILCSNGIILDISCDSEYDKVIKWLPMENWTGNEKLFDGKNFVESEWLKNFLR